MAGHARPCREDQYQIMTGASGSMRSVSHWWLYDLYFQLPINCASGRVHVNLYLDFSRAYPQKVIYLLKEEKFGLWRNNIPCRKVKVNCYPKLVVNWELVKKIVVNWEVGTPISTLFYVWLCGTQVTGMWFINFGFRNRIMRDYRWSLMPYGSPNLFCRLFMLRLMRRASFRCFFFLNEII